HPRLLAPDLRVRDRVLVPAAVLPEPGPALPLRRLRALPAPLPAAAPAARPLGPFADGGDRLALPDPVARQRGHPRPPLVRRDIWTTRRWRSDTFAYNGGCSAIAESPFRSCWTRLRRASRRSGGSGATSRTRSSLSKAT